jgi:predicted transposase YdaD
LLLVGNLSKFEKEIKTKIGRSDTMGTQEYLLDKAEKKGIQKGKIEGKIEMLRELGFTIAERCQKLGLVKPEVEKYFKGV